MIFDDVWVLNFITMLHDLIASQDALTLFFIGLLIPVTIFSIIMSARLTDEA